MSVKRKSMVLENWQDFCKGLAPLPGVYLMRDSEDAVIYIGKAKNLKARVKQYFQGHDDRYQIEFLVKKIVKVDTIVTQTEHQAFLLERDLINKHKPRYNIRLKDDKSYLSVRIDVDAAWPKLELTRRIEQDGATYYGPYTDAHQLYTLLDVVKRTVPLRTCSDTVFHNRQRPCLEYQLKRCLGPCCLAVDANDYKALLKQAVKILEGKNTELLAELEQRMLRASENLYFEEAAAIRDRLEILKGLKQSEVSSAHHAENRDVFGLYREGASLALTVMFVRNGRLGGSKNYSFSQTAEDNQELLERILVDFYSGGRELPSEIILPSKLSNEEMLEGVLHDRCGMRVRLHVPERGTKLQLLKIAELNAAEYFKSVFHVQERNIQTLKEMAKQFGLTQIPRRIECVDISNFQGSDIVAGVTSFFDGRPDKQHYRHFNLSFREKPDDFGCINEVVSRHIKRCLISDCLPDLLIIDGGQGQLNAAIAARQSLGTNVDIISLAKERTKSAFREKEVGSKPERIFVENQAAPILLENSNEVTLLLKRIRDETHRFAITFHRKKRSKRVFKSILDEIPGISPQRRIRLLKAFGSIAGLRGRSAAEISREGRLPLNLAEMVVVKIAET